MTLEPLIDAPLIIKLHVATLVPAWLIGTWLVFLSGRGSRWHRIMGFAFFGLLTATAIIALFIHRERPDSPFFGMSPTHITVPWTLLLVYLAIDSIRRGKIKRHRLCVLGLYWGSLTIVGLSNAIFLDHGVTHETFFRAPAQDSQLAEP